MAKKKDATRPTLKGILEKKGLSEQYWALLKIEQRTDFDYFDLKRQPVVPNGFNVVIPATGNSIILTAADHIAGDAPVLKVPTASIAIKAEERSERIERALQAVLERWEYEGISSTIRTLAINGLWSGMMVSQGPLFDAEAWGSIPTSADYPNEEQLKEAQKEYEAVKRTRWPFYWKVPNPLHVFPDPGTVGKKWVIVAYQRAAGEIKAQWPQWDMKLPHSNVEIREDTLIDWVEYWDAEWRAYIAGGEFVDEPRKHFYGKPPFQIRSGGFGTDSGLPHERFRSILYPARSLLDQEIRAACQYDGIMRQAAWPQILTPEGSGFDSLEPGTVKELRSVEDIAATKPVVGITGHELTALINELKFLDDQIQQATFPNVVSGMKAAGINSGYGQNSLVAQAKVRFGAPAVALSSLLSEFFQDFLHCVYFVVDEPVPVWGFTKKGFVEEVISPDDIDKYMRVRCVLNPKLPTDRATEIQIGETLVDRGKIDDEYFLENFVGVEQPQEMRIRILRDGIMNSPEAKRIMTLAALVQTGQLDYLMEAAQKLQIDPTMLLQSLGLIQQPGIMNGGGGAGRPMTAAAPPAGTPDMSALAQSKTQPQPGMPSAPPGPQQSVRNAATPGVPIR